MARTQAQIRYHEEHKNDPGYKEAQRRRNDSYYERNREKVKAKAALRRKTHAREIFTSELKRRYGISFEDWTEILLSQSGRCAICSTPLVKPCVDHDHADGRVRGLLCAACNQGLGKFYDDPGLLEQAARYLHRMG